MADAHKTTKHVVTNVTDGPKMLNAIPAIRLEAGASTDGEVELTDAEIASAKRTGWFEFGKVAAKKTADASDKTD